MDHGRHKLRKDRGKKRTRARDCQALQILVTFAKLNRNRTVPAGVVKMVNYLVDTGLPTLPDESESNSEVESTGSEGDEPGADTTMSYQHMTRSRVKKKIRTKD